MICLHHSNTEAASLLELSQINIYLWFHNLAEVQPILWTMRLKSSWAVVGTKLGTSGTKWEPCLTYRQNQCQQEAFVSDPSVQHSHQWFSWCSPSWSQVYSRSRQCLNLKNDQNLDNIIGWPTALLTFYLIIIYTPPKSKYSQLDWVFKPNTPVK